MCLQVVLGTLVFPLFLLLDFKTKEELQLMPQTVEEHIHELEDSDSDTSSDSGHDQTKSAPVLEKPSTEEVSSTCFCVQ